MLTSIYSINIEPAPGANINHFVKEIVDLAKKINFIVNGEFNGCLLIARPDSKPEELIEKYVEFLELRL